MLIERGGGGGGGLCFDREILCLRYEGAKQLGSAFCSIFLL